MQQHNLLTRVNVPRGDVVTTSRYVTESCECGKPRRSKNQAYCLECYAAYMQLKRRLGQYKLTGEARKKAITRWKTKVYVRRGKIKKSSECSICGSSYKIEAHHEDYSKPLDVVWLCRKCHVDLHNGKELAEVLHG